MRITRLIAGAVTTGLLGLSPVALSAPANATVVQPTTTATTPSTTQLEYGDDFYVSVAVTGSDGRSVSYGTSTLYSMEAGSTAWVPVATGTYPSSSFYDVKPKVATAYKVVYAGYTATSTYQDTYTASESAPFAVSVSRKLTIKNPRGTFVKGKVSPKYKKKKVLVQKKVRKKWKKFRVLKTNKKSQFQITLPASRKRTYWRFVVKGSSGLSTVTAEGSTIRYRSAAGRVAIR